VGKLIAFEGPEGAGKSTQIRHLATTFQSNGHSVLVTREPGGTPTGDAIRLVVLNPNLEINPLAEFLLYSASRAQHVSDVIRPALKDSKIVLTDRFAGASTAYQGHGRGLDLSFVELLNDKAASGLSPDLTILLDIDPVVGLERVGNRGNADRIEQADLQFHQRARQGFLLIANSDPSWVILDGNLNEYELASTIWKTVQNCFFKQSSGNS
jgi:dTMP kinase